MRRAHAREVAHLTEEQHAALQQREELTALALVEQMDHTCRVTPSHG